MNLTEVKQLLNKSGIRLSRKRGQNFLVEDGVISSLLREVQPGENDSILEIGTGLGALTEKLAPFKAKIFSFEIDRGVYSLVSERMAPFKNVKIIHEDFLKTDFFIKLDTPVRVIANIPYNIASQILIKLWLNRNLIQDMYLLVQKEFGERLAVEEGSRESSILSVILSLDYRIKVTRKVSPRSFFPVPDVDSVYLSFKPRDCIIKDELRKDFFLFVKKGFSQRRKKLCPRLKKDFPKTEDAFSELSLSTDCRAENLTPIQWYELFLFLKDCYL